MNIGIIGLPQTGKRTLFELLVGKDKADHRGDGGKTIRGVADVQDSRFDSLVEVYGPKKRTRARMEFLLPPSIEQHAISETDIFRNLAEVEVFCHVVREFENQTVYHASGSIDPVRDIDFVNAEFILHDHLFVEKRIDRLQKDLGKRKDEAGEKEKDLMLKLLGTLEEERPLRIVSLDPHEEKIIRSYPLLSKREMIVMLNVSDDKASDQDRLDSLMERYADQRVSCVQFSAKLEAEIASLESVDERAEFMEVMGVKETALHLLTRKCIDALGLISFFTVASDEVHQWFVERGSNAVQAAGKIHSDLARGFIRAEVIHFNDLIGHGGEEGVKKAGKLHVKSRDYVVEDGDILFIRFNV